ncbi:hypothetical protein BCR35DRAFT_299313 [Leucosporidium creatinivorum]|uniref:Uncharacterized protein n=1 Tax=Leucosporidium creatinivorum TaxID=106004 RepID=A0A1Y2G1G6_9BASI|nr:hypothetical protein BCR35DRAFT_299313 [Leucosporidium creatinivorum]
MANPYTPVIASIEDAVYDSPGHLFRVRIIILAVLLGLVALLTLVRFALLLVEFRRREESLWLAKWVKRSENQHFLVTHQRPINMIMVLVTSVILLAYVIRLHELYGDRTSLPQAAGWRNFSFFPLVLHGWLSGWSVLQSHLVVLESKGKIWGWWVAPLANTAYFASTAIMFIPLLTVAAVTTKSWRRVWTSYYQLHALLKQLESSWTPQTPSALPSQYFEFSGAVRRYLRFSVATKALYAAIVAITAIINTVALNLYYTMRKQINFNMAEMAPTSGRSSRRPSQAQVRELASHGIERAKRVQSLQYASSTVIQISFAMIFGGILFATCFGWAISVPTITLGFAHPVRWGAVECSAFLVVWIYALFYLPLSLKLIRDAWINLPNKETGSLRTIPPEDTLAHFFFERGAEATVLPRDGERISLKGVKRDTVARSVRQESAA